MGIGTSLGAFYEDEHHYNAVLWDPKRFEGDELMEKTPNEARTDADLDKAELDPTTGLGLEVGYKQINGPYIMGDRGIKFPPKEGGIEDRRNDPSYQMTDDNIVDSFQGREPGDYYLKDNKELDRPYTKLEKEAGLGDLDRTEINQIIRKDLASSSKAAEKTYYKSEYGSITDKDINKAIDIGLAASGGGLKTEAVETVGKAALKFGKDIFEGANHGLALDKLMAKFGGGDKIDFGKVADGFMTSKGRFVSREEAMTIARKNNQLVDKELHPSTTGLLSEDLVK